MEEEVLDKYKVEEGKREASRGRGDPLKMEEKKVERRLQGKNFVLVKFGEHNLQRLQSKQDEPTEERLLCKI